VKVGEVGFVIEQDGEYIGRRTRAGEKPFRSFADAERVRTTRVWSPMKQRFETQPNPKYDGSEIVAVKLVAVKMEVA
jgi:hypothetical protein